MCHARVLMLLPLALAAVLAGGESASIAAAVDPGLAERFARLTEQVRACRTAWLAQAEAAKPPLIRTRRDPVALVRIGKDATAFQGWKVVAAGAPASVLDRAMEPGESFILDFGQHITGRLVLGVRAMDKPIDAPLRLSLVFGEVPAEVAEPFDPYRGSLSRSWLQDEVVNIDEAPQTVTLPRRYAFRYVKVTVTAYSAHRPFGFSGIHAESVSSADEARVAPLAGRDAGDVALDQVSLRTLRDCMQTVFEDGPKRDRRLWLGDLRLQAQVNYVSFRHLDLVKRSLLILAGTASDQGLVSTCAFEYPAPMRGGDVILDYTALLAPTVLDWAEAGGDRATVESLWPLVLKQLDFTLASVGADGLFTPPKGWWLFVDWHPSLDKQAPLQAIILYGAKATLRLAQRLDRAGEVAFLPEVIRRMEVAARERLWDETQGCFVSGPKRAVSWASQAWMVLAGVPSPEQARRALAGVLKRTDADRPVSPYMFHHVVEALFAAGMADAGMALLRDYWGGMVAKGADTFWEVYVSGDDRLSPYGNQLMNSYGHAWSCTPAYFLRRPRP